MLRADFGVGILLASLYWKLQERTVISFLHIEIYRFKDGLKTCDTPETTLKNILQETMANALLRLLYINLPISDL